jgi:putative ABC transport system permease protein
MREFLEMGVDLITVRKDYRQEGGRELRLEDVLSLQRAGESFLHVTPLVTDRGEIGSGKRETPIELFGTTESFLAINKLRLREGRFLAGVDADRFVCVLGEEAARPLRQAAPGELLGRQILLGERFYTVVGVLERTQEGRMRPFGINRAAIVPITTATRTFRSGEIGSFTARVQGGKTPEQIRAEIQGHFARRDRGLRLDVATAEDMRAQMEKQLELFSLLLGAIGSIALIVGGIGVMNVMLIAVAERRKEIGLRRALGAQRRDIQAQFLIESVALCLAGGMLGILLGIGVSYAFAHFQKWPFLVAYRAILLGLGVSSAVGVFFGLYPARAASRLDPIAALRS